MQALHKVLSFTIAIIKAIMVALLSIMVVSMFFQVVARYCFKAGINWTEEVARFGNVWLIFLGCAVLVFMDGHIKVTLLDDTIKNEAFLKVLRVVRDIVQLVYFAVLVNIGIQTLPIVAKQVSPNMGLSMNLMYISIPLGAALSIVYLISIWLRKEENNG